MCRGMRLTVHKNRFVTLRRPLSSRRLTEDRQNNKLDHLSPKSTEKTE